LNEKKEPETKNKNILQSIDNAINKIKYGEVVITIHNSKVVQIEKREKKRF
jgi:hypothetical protein